MTKRTFAHILLEWYRENRRPLPWRETRDPYAIWLSEIILQQTRIEQGQPYWERFMSRWPRVEQLAAASEDEVLREWQGLGYYSRARNLHAAARQIVAMGHFPNTHEEIRKLKGVGDYTAAAIASFAFDIPAVVVDGNVCRVLSRYFGITTPINTTEGKKEITAMASEVASQPLIPAEAPTRSLSDYNQAIMDFGALQCTPRSPRCYDCPLNDGCNAFLTNRVNQLPVKLRKLKIRERRLEYLYIRHKDTATGQTFIAIRRRNAADIWRGLWEPVLLVDDGIEKLPHDVVSQLRQQSVKIFGNMRHVLTHRVIIADFYLMQTTDRPSLPPYYQWIREEDFEDYGKPRLIEILTNNSLDLFV